MFCVAKACSIALYQRFMAAFGGAGEANMPIDSGEVRQCMAKSGGAGNTTMSGDVRGRTPNHKSSQACH